MTTTTTIAAHSETPRRSAGDRLWPLFGTASAIGYFVGIATFSLDTPISDQRAAMRVGASAALLAAVLLPVYGIRLRRYLADQLPARSIIPAMASAGTVAASATIATVQLVRLALADSTIAVAHLGTAPNELLDTLSVGAWMPFLLTLVAVAVAGLRFGALPRWLSGVGVIAAIAGIVLIAAGGPPIFLPSAAWLTVSGLGLAIGRA